MRLFISWSGDTAQRLAALWRQWLLDAFPAILPYMSEEDIPPGGPWAHEITATLSEADYGLLCVTADNFASPWLNFEAGALARFEEGRVSPFLLNISPSDVSATPLGLFHATPARKEDVRRLMSAMNALSSRLGDQHAIHERSFARTFDAAWPQFMEGLDLLSARQAHRQRHLVQRGGHAYDYLINASIVPRVGAPAVSVIRNAWEHQLLIPSRYLYISEPGIDQWLNLCSDQTYQPRRAAMGFWNRESAAISTAISDALPQPEFSFVSLGPGDGRKDADLIQEWAQHELTYHPYDVSVRMLSHAVTKVRETVGRERSRSLGIKAIVADFDQIDSALPMIELRPVPKVFSLLGNTLGNFASEREFILRIRNRMAADDLLLLEVRLRGPWEAVQEGNIGEQHYAFGPLQYLGLSFEEERFTYHTSDVGLGDLPNTRTTLALYDHPGLGDKRFPPAKLEYIHEYDRGAFLDALPSLGYEVVKQFGQDNDPYLACLLRTSR